MPRCDLFLTDHRDDATGAWSSCDDQDHAAAIRRRQAGAPKWSPIVHGRDAGGKRDFLDGKPIHCGASLELQAYNVGADDFGEFLLPTEMAVSVRYETDRDGVVLYHEAGGHLFTRRLAPHMRFRWPARTR